MLLDISTILLEINRKFYHDFAGAFAATRQRIQPGVRRVLDGLSAGGDWLDLGCGSGNLASVWAEKQIQTSPASYLGLDFSSGLLAAAAKEMDKASPSLKIEFQPADLLSAHWSDGLPVAHFDIISAFAVLHHIPGSKNRRSLLNQVRRLLRPDGRFIHSEWQFQNSPQWMERRQPWEMVGLNSSQLEEGDTLLDWRYALPGQEEQRGLRYVHLFSRQELSLLAAESGFKIDSEFESDGKGGHLALYQIWKTPCA